MTATVRKEATASMTNEIVIALRVTLATLS